MASTDTIAAHAGDVIAGHDLASDNPYARAEVAEDCSHITVIWNEPLNWHSAYNTEGYGNLIGDDNYFTNEARTDFAAFMAEFMAGQEWNVAGADIQPEDGEEWDDEPCVAISYRFNTPNGPATTMEEFSDKSWPFIAAMTNTTDPGTYNNPYIMAELVRRHAAKQDA